MGYYTKEKIDEFEREYRNVCQGLEELMLQTVVAGQESTHAGVKEYLLHGICRRLNIIKKSIENIFNEFPLTTTKPLSRDALCDVQINLQAYVMNLYGIFDNWAWVFIYKNNLLKQVGGKHGVGLFNKKTKKHLPQPLQDYLSSEAMNSWHENYLKSYRDALAHRIPLYIPPAEFTHEESVRYNQLETEKIKLIKAMAWDKLNEVNEEQTNIGRPSFCFLHSYEERPPQLVLFHPQILCDGLAIVEFGTLYMEQWNENT